MFTSFFQTSGSWDSIDRLSGFQACHFFLFILNEAKRLTGERLESFSSEGAPSENQQVHPCIPTVRGVRHAHPNRRSSYSMVWPVGFIFQSRRSVCCCCFASSFSMLVGRLGGRCRMFHCRHRNGYISKITTHEVCTTGRTFLPPFM